MREFQHVKGSDGCVLIKGVLMSVFNEINTGDILCVNRGLYKHYGIYAGNSTVIHYTAPDGDFGIDASIHKTALKEFEDGGVAQVVKLHGTGKQFSPEETVRRAISRIGEKKYNLLFNNCEHFALWCKTGMNKSCQVERAAGTVILVSMAIVLTKLVISANDNRE
jgi:hypothetical protein